ncbi:MAG: hypothetical protein U9Q92_06460 [archaeon]|nr:hypothetical protein [archaeon]
MIKAISESDIGAIVDALNDNGSPDLKVVKADGGKKGLIYGLERSGYKQGNKYVQDGGFSLYGKEVTVEEIIRDAGGRDNVGEPYLEYCEAGGKLYEEITAEYRIGCVKSAWKDLASEFFRELASFKRQKKVNGYPEVSERDCMGGKKCILRDVIGQGDINFEGGKINPGNIEGRIGYLYREGKKLMRVQLELESLVVVLNSDASAHRRAKHNSVGW